MKTALIYLILVMVLFSACGPWFSSTATPTPSTLLPDLVISGVRLEMQGMPSGTTACVSAYAPYEVRVSVTNQGDGAAFNIPVVEMSSGYEIQLGVLEAGRSMELDMPASSPTGIYDVKVDPQNQVAESNEDNNGASYLAPTPTPPALCPTPTAVSGQQNEALAGLIYTDMNRAEMWKVGSGGHAFMIMQGLDARFSSDGKAVYEQGGDLWLAEPMDRPGVPITNTPDRMESSPQWWPSRPGTIVFDSWDVQEAQANHWTHETNSGYLSTLNADGSGYLTLADTPSFTLPAPGTDGRTIAYDANGIPMLYEEGLGSREVELARFGYQPAEETLFTSPSWSPDGRWLTWWMVENSAQPDRRFSLLMLDLRANAYTILHSYVPIDGTLGWLSNPVWSPDAQWIAYSTAGEVTNWDLQISRPDGSDAYRLGLATNPVWSPDSKNLAYVQWPPRSDSYLSAMVNLVEAQSWTVSAPALPAGSIPSSWPKSP